MKRLFITFLCILLCLTIGYSQSKTNNTYRVFFLGGQSNMVGYGYNRDLPDSLKQFDDVWIFHGNTASDGDTKGGLGLWEKLKPGHGRGFSSDGKQNNRSDRFGVELSFAKSMQHLYPNEKIAIIKYAKGGSTIDSLAAGDFGCWEPDFRQKGGINQYDHFLTTMRQALNTRDIDGDGIEDQLIPSGILWMQGESDATYNEAVALKYYDNLKRLMDLIRASLLTDDLPVVIGKISDSWDNPEGKVWKYGELIQYAQEKYARTDSYAAIVKSTRYYKYSDRWHYDSAGYIDFGEQFAKAIYYLDK